MHLIAGLAGHTELPKQDILNYCKSILDDDENEMAFKVYTIEAVSKRLEELFFQNNSRLHKSPMRFL